MYERALVPLDGSEFSRQVLHDVVRLAPQEIVLVAVMESVASALARQTGIVTDVPADLAEQVKAAEVGELRRHLREAAQQLAESGWSGAAVQVIHYGKPGEQIVELAKEMSCDIVVMATHGRSGIRRALLGSVADYVVSHIRDAAVLLVRP